MKFFRNNDVIHCLYSACTNHPIDMKLSIEPWPQSEVFCTEYADHDEATISGGQDEYQKGYIDSELLGFAGYFNFPDSIEPNVLEFIGRLGVVDLSSYPAGTVLMEFVIFDKHSAGGNVVYCVVTKR